MSNSAHRPAIPLGPFDLHARIGRGGMGEVWRGVHRAQGLEVAVKVIMGEHARKPHFVSAFRREVQTVAGLDHGGIILVLDYGEVTKEAEQTSEGALVAGSPYLAMELASGGSLGLWMRKGQLAWAQVEAALLALLEALGHAHAAGIIHRDLKPANVLWSKEDAAWKLTDFGVSHALDQSRKGSVEKSLGTPSYMAPEQIRGRWRDYGPWTDLYSLGCMAFQMVCLKPPFTGKGPKDIAAAHLAASAPRMSPVIPVPSGFSTWLLGLLRKRPEERFQRAADAADALASLVPPSGDIYALPRIVEAQPKLEVTSPSLPESSPEAFEEGGEGTVILDPSRSSTGNLERTRAIRVLSPAPRDESLDTDDETLLLALESIRKQGRHAPTEPPIGMVANRPPLPHDWRRRDQARRTLALVDAGLGLYGLRSVPLVGREDERDRLWAQLSAVRDTRTMRACVLRGPAGTGKSRLAQWLCRLAHEVGAAHVLRATHSPIGAVSDGLPRMVSRFLCCVGLESVELERRTERVLQRKGIDDPWDWQALTEFMTGGSERLANPAARHALLARFIDLISSDRPTIIWLDDVQYGLESLAFAAHLMETRHLAPALILLTAQGEALAESHEARDNLSRLEVLTEVETIEVGPLGEHDQSKLVEELLGLERDAASHVVARSAGNPLFAVQIVGDWIQRGLLRVGGEGFSLVPGADVALPDDLHLIWTERIGRLLDGRSGSDRMCLQIAAILGQEVSLKEWVEACQKAGIMGSVALVDALVDRGLGLWTEDGWAFVHGMLRESIARMARESDNRERLHRACAAMLAEHYPTGTPGIAERLGRHLLDAGEVEDALAPVLTGAQERFNRAEYGASLSLLDRRDAAIDTIGLTEDPRVAEGWLLRSRVYRLQGRFEEASAQLARTVSLCESAGWTATLARGLTERSDLSRRLGDLEGAEAVARRALSLFEHLDDPEGHAHAILGLGAVAYNHGDMRTAEDHYREALRLFQSLDDELGVTRVLRLLAEIAQADEAWDEALDLYEAALDYHQRRGNRYNVAAIMNGMAEVHRFRDDLDRAEVQYRQALSIMEGIGSSECDIARVNLALVLIARGRYADARVNLETLIDRFERTGQSALLGGVHAELLPCAAAAGDWQAWDRHMTIAAGLLGDSGVADPDDAWPAQLAADLAVEAGQTTRARVAYLLARGLWKALGRDDKAAEINGRLDTL